MTMRARTMIGLALVLAACKGGSEEPKTPAPAPETAKKPEPAASGDITIGILADLTGGTADVGKPYNEGMLAYIDNLNASGGIKGKKINAMSEDYAYKVPNA